MIHPFRRTAVLHRPTLQPAPGTRAFEVDALEVTEGNGESDWAMWEDSVQELDGSLTSLDPFDKVGRRDR